ncbi:nucleotide-diphospho-sugar transferase [Hortaea werneckii]|nr:nucleotide-diphospho-sugar transferase [Hortaea werneckii]KAI7082237.1 nucleotide-diphospho-sugar transferase [Hortaea werneckii]KAI7243499.1 nucleotide-diphospho-sugar transferase [Hortaea werneckii]KAI7307437.1 nucleotide-diphospho-sugar transferase [Hortaea werneckii]KAI7391760.1 nucleotide-diphospho-sugar transferase [Hortaea werneckii]
MGVQQAKKYAYTTLITRASYLAGVLILAHTLKKQGSRHPLLVYYTDGLQQDAVRALELEAPKLDIILKPVDLLLPPADVKVQLIAERFGDTWTKLRVFDCVEYDAVCYLDADMAIYRNMDEIFTEAERLPHDWLAANHACVCNLERDPWAPADWREENCAFTPTSHPEALYKPTQQTPDSRPTWHLLNGGMFLYHPSKELWDDMLHCFNTSDKLSTYKFPDQDFLADYFRDRWMSLGWQYNALKTMRYWHPNIWRDEEVRCLHYIVDKPWAARVVNGVAGYRGKDGETHSWWWREYGEWVNLRRASHDDEVLKLVSRYVAKEDGTENDDPDMKAIGSKVQAFANNKVPTTTDSAKGPDADKENRIPLADDGTALPPQKVLGENGHGPVLTGRGSGQILR